MEFEDCSKLKEGTSLKLQNLDKKINQWCQIYINHAVILVKISRKPLNRVPYNI